MPTPTSSSAIPRSAGIGLLVYAVGTAVAFMASGSPGGSYRDTMVTGYTSGSHLPAAMALWFLGGLSALALVLFGTGIRRLPRTGASLASLVTVGAAVSLVGAFVSGGLEVAMAEGGHAVRAGVPHPVVFLVTEIGNLLAVCGPAMCVGVVAVALATGEALPTWLKVLSIVGGICGILAPFFITYFLYLLWALVAGIAFTVRGRTVEQRDLAPAAA